MAKLEVPEKPRQMSKTQRDNLKATSSDGSSSHSTMSVGGKGKASQREAKPSEDLGLAQPCTLRFPQEKTSTNRETIPTRSNAF